MHQNLLQVPLSNFHSYAKQNSLGEITDIRIDEMVADMRARGDDALADQIQKVFGTPERKRQALRVFKNMGITMATLTALQSVASDDPTNNFHHYYQKNIKKIEEAERLANLDKDPELINDPYKYGEKVPDKFFSSTEEKKKFIYEVSTISKKT